MGHQIWLSKEILEWNIDGGESFSVSLEEWKRPYEIWEFSRKLIDENNDRDNLSEGIISLKRSYEKRQKSIIANYPLGNINFNYKVPPKKRLELMEQYGLIRPLLIKKLLDIRNSIEHTDKSPPNKSECLELLDYVWFFLKSTDELVLNVPNKTCMRNENSFVWIDLNMEETSKENANVVFNFEAYLTLDKLSFVKKTDHICLENLEIVSERKELEEVECYESSHLTYKNNAIFIKGKLTNGNDQYQILKKILADPWR
ncbi:hypothetical protein [Halalkalibacter oceani]|uniref:hypothetical protein n=1 Tax=Halalkalibacter oceani TaxID=1653776 RepID=UPI00339797AA